ncbi:HERC2, partial [Symbiodinium natans]
EAASRYAKGASEHPGDYAPVASAASLLRRSLAGAAAKKAFRSALDALPSMAGILAAGAAHADLEASLTELLGILAAPEQLPGLEVLAASWERGEALDSETPPKKRRKEGDVGVYQAQLFTDLRRLLAEDVALFAPLLPRLLEVFVLGLQRQRVQAGDAILKAQRVLQTGTGIFLAASGEVLCLEHTLAQAGVQAGDVLTLQVRQTRVAASSGSFTALLADGSVVSWGENPCCEKLVNVQQIQEGVCCYRGQWICGDLGSFMVRRSEGSDMAPVQVHVALLSGRRASITASSDTTLADLMLEAQSSLQTGAGVFVNARGEFLSLEHTLAQAGVQAEDVLTLQVRQSRVAACSGSFTALLGDGIQAADSAFAAILENGSVVTWGGPSGGGDSSGVQAQLQQVKQIQSSSAAFAAILEDGSVVTWGDPRRGGDSSAVQEQLKNVQQIQATWEAFAAILADGSVVTWGLQSAGADSSEVQEQLREVQHLQATSTAFAAILSSGSVVTWGDPDTRVPSSSNP